MPRARVPDTIKADPVRERDLLQGEVDRWRRMFRYVIKHHVAGCPPVEPGSCPCCSPEGITRCWTNYIRSKLREEIDGKD